MPDISPEEAVAYGTAIQSAALEADTSDSYILCCDYTPLTLGIQTVDKAMATIIPKNTMIPTKKTHIFKTAFDSQSKVTLQIYQGRRPLAKDNQALGKFDLIGLTPASRGDTRIAVTFKIDVNGNLKVSAEEIGRENKEELVINNEQNNLSPEDIERMIDEAEKFSEEDDQIRKGLKYSDELGYL